MDRNFGFKNFGFKNFGLKNFGLGHDAIAQCDRWGAGLLLAIVLFVVTWCGDGGQVALASIHRYPLDNGQSLCRSLQSLRDRSDMGWQLVLFAPVQNDQPPQANFRLRVVGFPTIHIDRSRPLVIAGVAGAIGQISDTFPFGETALNTGEYDVTEVINRVGQWGFLSLLVPTDRNEPSEILLPSFALQEWQAMHDQGC
ncbi:MAG: DUF3122 domain-containing protein [Oscillatoriales cyanobacterium]|nr:MAG: DUF3122 domain-containing protein [Oscillatoriales cyanobacterium]